MILSMFTPQEVTVLSKLPPRLRLEAVKRRAAVKVTPVDHPASSSLLDFTTYTMPTYEANWHHRLVCEHLDKFARLEITRLMIFMPPRTGKSELVSRRLPAYLLGKNPDTQIISASYGADLARRMNRDVQRIIDDKLYFDVFPRTRLFGSNIRTVSQGTWLRNSDIFEVAEYSGYYRSSGVGGAITGMGMQYGIIDDPLKNRKEANSLVVRNSIWEWYTSTFRTRLAPGGGILLTVTRWHEDDLAGRLLELAADDPRADQWTVLTLPAIAEEPIADYDPRQEGDPLWPGRFDHDELDATRISIGSYDWSSLYQQRPAPKEGGMFKYSWFKIADAVPHNIVKRVRYWDKAGTEGGGKYSCGVLMGKTSDNRMFVENVVRGQWSALGREQAMLTTAQLDRATYGNVEIWNEQEPGSGGKESAEATSRNLAGFNIHSERATGDKQVRALPFAAQCEAGNVFLVNGQWNHAYIEELTSFPFGACSDQVDGSSGSFNKLYEVGKKQVGWM